MKKTLIFSLLTLIFVASCRNKEISKTTMEIQAPKADKIEKHLEKHGDVRIDNYYWLNERDNEEVIDYLERENDYYDRMTEHTKDFQKSLFEEMKSRIKEDDESVPYRFNGYYYITKYEKGKDYPIYTRKRDSLEAEEELLFDVNEMAEGHSYYNLSGLSVSPDNTKISFGVDTVSRRKYTIYIKDLLTGTILDETIPLTTGGSTWANDNSTLFYTQKDEQTLRSNKIFRHRLGTSSLSDELIFTEEDETFGTFVFKTKSKKFLVIGSYSTLTSEYRILNADTPFEDFKIFQPRVRGLEYSISHYDDSFYVLTNMGGASNFKLMKTSDDTTLMDNWEEMIAHRDDVLLEDIDIFKDYYVISERSNGLNRIKVVKWDGTDSYYLPFDNETYTAFVSVNPEFDSKVLRYVYNSLITPSSIIDFNMDTREQIILKETEVLGTGFNKNNYESKRIWAAAADGTSIPVSMVYKKGMKMNGKTPLLLYAYGSYGSTVDPYFSTVRLSLLDRGFIFAIAHVRGSEYLGRSWYENGKLLKKKNTFTDFIDVSKYLIANKYTSSKHLYANGGSAGGLLMGAISNMAPEIYNGIVAEVPFVDVTTTMLDDSIPLTTGEYDEWGNPNEKEYYDYMTSYSPYDQVAIKDYPNLLVTTGLHDSQVQYWEPAKWVAKLRDMKTDTNLLLLHINMEAGHGGASGRFNALKKYARSYSFLLDLEGVNK